ncbi:adiponectin receptor protein-like [Paramacrobiotus metropolitanus]|uniref:adiponectin receptor protein-like n=1 Tax=Paramacrobiotus metropolitanus TaxID=2943436 RepID=UPI00244655FC|nr:adiponectin receptor protein-like [Paramacrobiotus metropolitanus]
MVDYLDPSAIENEMESVDDPISSNETDSQTHLLSGVHDEENINESEQMLKQSSEMIAREGLRERMTARRRSRLECDSAEGEEILLDPKEFPPLPEASDPSIFEEMRADGEAALAAGMEFLSETSEKAQRIIQRVITDVWKQTHFHHLPEWLKDNDFLHFGHRPQIQSFRECFKSIFRIHTETVNIWTHMIGCIAFVAVATYFLAAENFAWTEKWMFSAFFAGAVLCLGFSFLFHTVYCHSQSVGKFFSKLDYCGIALLTLGSFVPWLHFGFYCRSVAKHIYIGVISVLAITAIVVSLWDKFSEPAYRALRAGVFVALGLSGVIPAIHYVSSEGWVRSVHEGSMIYLVLMGVLYVSGAVLYACRVPERWFPGRFDIWFQSHQIFHVLVVIAAFVHYHGISLMANHRFTLGACPQISDTASWFVS